MTPRTVVVVAAVLFSLGVTACRGDPDPMPPNPPPPPSITTPVSETPTTPDCAAGLPYALTFTPETVPELLLNKNLSGCTDGAKTEIAISAESSVPWVIDKPPRKWSSLDSDSPEIATLRHVMQNEDGLVIAPGESVRLDFPPEQIHLTLTAESAAAWRGVHTVTEQVRKKAESRAVDLLADGRPARRAAVICGIEGVKFGHAIGDVNLDGSSATEQLDAALGLGNSAMSGARSCSGAIDEAERELSGSVPGEVPVLSLEDARAITIEERPRFSTAFGAALRRAAQNVHRL